MGRRGMSMVMGVLIMIVFVVFFSGIAWFFINSTQGQLETAGQKTTDAREAETSTLLSIDMAIGKSIYIRNVGKTLLSNFTIFVNGEYVTALNDPGTLHATERAIISIPFELKKRDYIKITTTYGAIATYFVERTMSARCGNGRCEFPQFESCTSCPEDCGNCLDGVSGSAYPANVKLGQAINLEMNMTAHLVPDIVAMTILLPNGTIEEENLTQTVGSTWEGIRIADQPGIYVVKTEVKEKGGPYLPQTLAGVVSTASWWDSAWLNRKPIFADENTGFGRGDEYVLFNYTDLTLPTLSCNEVRITDPYGVLKTYQIMSEGPDKGWCQILTTFSAMEYISGQVVGYIYFNNPSAAAPVFSTDLLPFNPATGCMENSQVRMCFGLGANNGGISYLSSQVTGIDQNLLSENARDTKFYRKGIQPQVDYREGMDILWCSNYTLIESPRLLVDGPLYQEVNYSFGTVCEGSHYDYRYTAEMYAHRNGYDLLMESLTPIYLTPNVESVIAMTNWNPAVVSMTTQGATCGYDRCFSWSDPTKSPLSLGAGTVQYAITPLAAYLPIWPLHGATITDWNEIPASNVILKTRAILTSRADIFGAVDSELNAKSNGLQATMRLGESETEN